MRLTIGVSAENRVADIVKVANIAHGNIDGVWLTSFSGERDVFTLSSVVLDRSPQLNLGIGIVSPLTWHITTIARASAGLNEMSPGRFRLGIGVGGLQGLSKEGIVARPMRLLSETFQILREIWTGKEVTVSGDAAQLTHYAPRYSCPDPIPVYFGVRGPRLLELVSKFADGVLLSGPRSYLESAAEIVRKNSDASGKHPVVAAWFPFILEEYPYSLAHVKRSVAMILGDTPFSAIKMSDLPARRCERIQRFVAKGNLAAASRLVDDAFVDEVCIRGGLRSACRTIAEIGSLRGIDEVIAGPPLTQNWVDASGELIESWTT